MKKRSLFFVAAGHLFTDFNQGALPAILPFLISEQGLSYTAAASLVLAYNFSAGIVQPLIGHFADHFSKPWLMPLGVFLGGLGMSITGIIGNYWLIFAAVTLSGIGAAAFHPEGARLANQVSGEKAAFGMSIFSTGGNGGFAIGPIVTTGAMLIWGLKGTLVIIIPIVVTALLLFRELQKLDYYHQYAKPETVVAHAAKKSSLPDEWGPFSRLTIAVFSRASIFFALNTFIPLFWIHNLSQSKAAGASALTIMLTAGVVGMLIGGRLGDHFGCPALIRAASCLELPLLIVFTNTTDILLANLLLGLLGLILFCPIGPMIVLGQQYLPNRMGLASGIILGLAAIVGGITTSALGWVADHYGLAQVLTVVAYLPLVTIIAAFTVKPPQTQPFKANQPIYIHTGK